MSEAEQRHGRKVQPVRTAAYRKTVAIASEPPHSATLPRPPLTNERLA